VVDRDATNCPAGESGNREDPGVSLDLSYSAGLLLAVFNTERAAEQQSAINVAKSRPASRTRLRIPRRSPDPLASNMGQPEEMKMTILGMAALSCLVMAAALAGCVSSSYSPDKRAGHMKNADLIPLKVDYKPNQTAPRTIGRVVTTVAGATLYTFDEDQNGESTCYDDCAKQWPPLIALSTAKAHWRMSLTTRTDGQRQWSYDGKPLYTYAADTMRGDIKGDNVGNVWHVIR
jgi:predicted lipoprotein with Yx(FWY)xxD motif